MAVEERAGAAVDTAPFAALSVVEAEIHDVHTNNKYLNRKRLLNEQIGKLINMYNPTHYINYR